MASNSNRKVFKYEIQNGNNDSKYVFMPARHNILSVQKQDDLVVLWALVDPMDKCVVHDLKQVMTGQEFKEEDDFMYLATLQLPGGIVSHYFKKLMNYV